MIYVISKSTCGDYNVRDIQCNANWDCCPYSDYALIPDDLVEGILSTQGYCDIVLNDEGTAVVSFTANEIPEVPRECCGLNTVLSVNGKNANADGELRLEHGDVGAVGTQAVYVESVDEITKSGYYELDVFVDGSNGRFACSAVVGGGEVRLTGSLDGGTLQYTKADGWEWVAPPMLLFQEYRTTERFEGKPVYAKHIYLGYLPANTSGHIAHGISGVDKIVSCDLSFYKNAETYSAPYFENGTVKAYAQANDTYVTVGTTADYSAYIGLAVLKCTKK